MKFRNLFCIIYERGNDRIFISKQKNKEKKEEEMKRNIFTRDRDENPEEEQVRKYCNVYMSTDVTTTSMHDLNSIFTSIVTFSHIRHRPK